MSANIAITYAQAGYKTLIIDGDMRKPTQHYHFETSNYDGLSNLIIEIQILIKQLDLRE